MAGPPTESTKQPNLEELYHEAYALVEQGICYDEVGQRDGALAMYERGLRLIDQAGQMPGAEGNIMYSKMVAAREHILYRLKDLRSGLESTQVPSGIEEGLPPPYESIEHTIEAFGESKSAEELFLIPSGVQIFMIRGEETSVPSYPDSLRIFKFKPEDDGQAASSSGPPAFLQVGDWIYPLVPGRSPVLHSSYGAYIFPNPTADEPELYIGVLLPSDLDKETVEGFENSMQELTNMHRQTSDMHLTQAESERLSTKISKFIISTAEVIVWGLDKGAHKTNKFIAKHSESMRAGEKTEKPMVIDPRVQTSVHYLRKGSKVAVKCSGYLVDKIGQIACNVGKQVAQYAEKKSGGVATKEGGLVHDAITVFTGGVAGMATVYMGLEAASKVLARNIANETVKVVDHKYGGEAGKVTNDALFAAGHGGMAAWNVYELGPKSIMKRSAKHAGVEFLKDLGGPKNKEIKAETSKNEEKKDSAGKKS